MNYDKSNTYRDVAHDFSVTPPQNWDSTKYPSGTVTFTPPDGSAFFTVFNHDKTDVDQNSFTDDELLFVWVNAYTSYKPGVQYTVLTSGIYHYSDGIKENMTIKETSAYGYTIHEHTYYFFNNGVRFSTEYWSTPNEFKQYLGDVHKSIDTIYVSAEAAVIPEFGSLTTMVVLVSVIGTIVISKRFSKV